MTTRALAISLILLFASQVCAQEPPIAPVPVETARAVQAKAQRIRAIFQAVDAKPTRFSALFKESPVAGYYGYAVLPTEDDRVWRVIHLVKDNERVFRHAEVEVTDGQVTSEIIHPEEARPLAQGMARDLAVANALALGSIFPRDASSLCARGGSSNPRQNVSFTILAMPPSEGEKVTVYVLNGPFDDDTLPLGRHYRVSVDLRSQIAEPTLITSSCDVISLGDDRVKGDAPSQVSEAPGSTYPNEVSVFLSSLLPEGTLLSVKTDELMWHVVDGTVGSPTPILQDDD